MTRNRIHIIRTWPTFWEVIALIGGVIVVAYLVGYVMTIGYAKFERKINTVIKIFYYT